MVFRDRSNGGSARPKTSAAAKSPAPSTPLPEPEVKQGRKLRATTAKEAVPKQAKVEPKPVSSATLKRRAAQSPIGGRPAAEELDGSTLKEQMP